MGACEFSILSIVGICDISTARLRAGSTAFGFKAGSTAFLLKAGL
jgi:hypothetical protein